MDTELFRMLGETPVEIINGYRGRLDAGFHDQQVDFHFEVGPSMANAYGDHGNATAYQILALAIASGIADLAAEGILHYGDPTEVADSVDAYVETEIRTATEIVEHLIKSGFRDHLIRTTLDGLDAEDDDNPDTD